MLSAKTDTRRLHGKLKALPRTLERGSERGVDEETKLITQDMRDGAPVDKGELLAGIKAVTRGPHGEAVSTAPHTTYVVHGTSSAPAQDFMGPAAAQGRRRAPKTIGRNIKRELGKGR